MDKHSKIISIANNVGNLDAGGRQPKILLEIKIHHQCQQNNKEYNKEYNYTIMLIQLNKGCQVMILRLLYVPVDKRIQLFHFAKTSTQRSRARLIVNVKCYLSTVLK